MRFNAGFGKQAAKERGTIEHKGKEIPAEVKSLADRIRDKEPDVSDEYAYRTAWDIFRSYTKEGEKHPHKSEVSGLAVEGGKTGKPLSNKKPHEESDEKLAFMRGFNKIAVGLGSQLAVRARQAGRWIGKNPGKAALGAGAALVGTNLAQGKGLRQSLTSSPLAPTYEEKQ